MQSQLAVPFCGIRVTGPDAERYLQGQLTADVAALAPGGLGSLAALLEADGHLVTWLRVRRTGDTEFLLVVADAHRERVHARLLRYLIRTRATVQVTDARLLAEVPDGRDPLWPLEADRDLAQATPDEGAYRDASLALGAFDPAIDLVDGLLVQGVPTLFERGVSTTKGCYTGQELVARTDARGAAPPLALAALELSRPVRLDPGTRLLVDGAEAGWVTRAAIVNGRGLAIGVLKRRFASTASFAVGGGLDLDARVR